MHASVYMSLSIYPIVCSIFAIPVVPCQLCGKVSLERYRKCAFSALRLLSRARTSSLVFEYRTVLEAVVAHYVPMYFHISVCGKA